MDYIMALAQTPQIHPSDQKINQLFSKEKLIEAYGGKKNVDQYHLGYRDPFLQKLRQKFSDDTLKKIKGYIGFTTEQEQKVQRIAKQFKPADEVAGIIAIFEDNRKGFLLAERSTIYDKHLSIDVGRNSLFDILHAFSKDCGSQRPSADAFLMLACIIAQGGNPDYIKPNEECLFWKGSLLIRDKRSRKVSAKFSILGRNAPQQIISATAQPEKTEKRNERLIQSMSENNLQNDHQKQYLLGIAMLRNKLASSIGATIRATLHSLPVSQRRKYNSLKVTKIEHSGENGSFELTVNYTLNNKKFAIYTKFENGKLTIQKENIWAARGAVKQYSPRGAEMLKNLQYYFEKATDIVNNWRGISKKDGLVYQFQKNNKDSFSTNNIAALTKIISAHVFEKDVTAQMIAKPNITFNDTEKKQIDEFKLTTKWLNVIDGVKKQYKKSFAIKFTPGYGSCKIYLTTGRGFVVELNKTKSQEKTAGELIHEIVKNIQATKTPKNQIVKRTQRQLTQLKQGVQKRKPTVKAQQPNVVPQKAATQKRQVVRPVPQRGAAQKAPATTTALKKGVTSTNQPLALELQSRIDHYKKALGESFINHIHNSLTTLVTDLQKKYPKVNIIKKSPPNIKLIKRDFGIYSYEVTIHTLDGTEKTLVFQFDQTKKTAYLIDKTLHEKIKQKQKTIRDIPSHLKINGITAHSSIDEQRKFLLLFMQHIDEKNTYDIFEKKKYVKKYAKEDNETYKIGDKVSDAWTKQDYFESEAKAAIKKLHSTIIDRKDIITITLNKNDHLNLIINGQKIGVITYAATIKNYILAKQKKLATAIENTAKRFIQKAHNQCIQTLKKLQKKHKGLDWKVSADKKTITITNGTQTHPLVIFNKLKNGKTDYTLRSEKSITAELAGLLTTKQQPTIKRKIPKITPTKKNVLKKVAPRQPIQHPRLGTYPLQPKASIKNIEEKIKKPTIAKKYPSVDPKKTKDYRKQIAEKIPEVNAPQLMLKHVFVELKKLWGPAIRDINNVIPWSAFSYSLVEKILSKNIYRKGDEQILKIRIKGRDYTKDIFLRYQTETKRFVVSDKENTDFDSITKKSECGNISDLESSANMKKILTVLAWNIVWHFRRNSGFYSKYVSAGIFEEFLKNKDLTNKQLAEQNTTLNILSKIKKQIDNAINTTKKTAALFKKDTLTLSLLPNGRSAQIILNNTIIGTTDLLNKSESQLHNTIKRLIHNFHQKAEDKCIEALAYLNSKLPKERRIDIDTQKMNGKTLTLKYKGTTYPLPTQNSHAEKGIYQIRDPQKIIAEIKAYQAKADTIIAALKKHPQFEKLVKKPIKISANIKFAIRVNGKKYAINAKLMGGNIVINKINEKNITQRTSDKILNASSKQIITTLFKKHNALT